MKKKALIFTLALSLVTAGFLGTASAAQNVANTSQKGSLLVFPKVVIDEYKDTIIRISNDYPGTVNLKCFWLESYNLFKKSFEITMCPNQPIWFSAKTGAKSCGAKVATLFPVQQGCDCDPSGSHKPGCVIGPVYPATGELKCFAVDAQGQISWNHLYGSAVIVDYVSGEAFEYNSWNFTARSVALGKPVGKPGEIMLTGQSGAYDACPQYLTSEFPAAMSETSEYNSEWTDPKYPEIGLITNVGAEITLSLCREDFRQDGEAIATKALFSIWDENGIKSGGAYKCINTWFEGFLHEIGPGTDPWTKLPIGGLGGGNFKYAALHTTSGRFRVSGVASTVCESPYYFSYYGKYMGCYDALGVGPVDSTAPTPLIGVLTKYYGCNYYQTSDGDGYGDYYRMTGRTPNTAGADPRGFILYDAGSGITPEAAD